MSKKKSTYPKSQYYATPSAPPGPQGYGPQGYGPQGYGPPGYGPPGQPGYNSPPPPYSPYATGVPAPAKPYPTSNPNMMAASPGYGGYNPQYPTQPQVPPLGYPTGYCQNQPVVAHFDPGARFNGGMSCSIPPPPPGCAPNAAQLAAQSAPPGTQVIGQQQQTSWLTGGTGGGMSLF